MSEKIEFCKFTQNIIALLTASVPVAETEMSRRAETTGQIPRKAFGSTGFQASILGLGGGNVAISEISEEVGVQIVKRAIDLGINYIDTADCYGKSEEIIGEALGPCRHEVFLATKYDARDAKGARELLNRSLKRLQTDYIDLYQLHGLGSEKELNQIFALDGAMKTVLKAKEEGKVRFLGISGHSNPQVVVEALKRFPFTSVLIPINVIESIFLETVLPIAQEKNVAIVAMKVGGGGSFTTNELVAKSLRFNFGLPVNVTVLGARTVEQIEHAAWVARNYISMTNEEKERFRQEMEERAAEDPSAYWWRQGLPVPSEKYMT